MPIVVQRGAARMNTTRGIEANAPHLPSAKRWRARRLLAEELMTLGEQVYTKNCVACHQATGKGCRRYFRRWRAARSRPATGRRTSTASMRGVAGTAMQAFGTQLNAAEIAAVVHYERHSWGNTSDDITQPIDVSESGFGAVGVKS